MFPYRTLSLNCRKYNCNRYPNYRLLMTSLNQRTLELNQKRKKETFGLISIKRLCTVLFIALSDLLSEEDTIKLKVFLPT
jgi:hypothetical protein